MKREYIPVIHVHVLNISEKPFTCKEILKFLLKEYQVYSEKRIDNFGCQKKKKHAKIYYHRSFHSKEQLWTRFSFMFNSLEP